MEQVQENRLFVVGWIIVSLLFICMILSPLSVKAEQPDVADVIKTFNATLLESMKRAKELGFSGRYKLLAPVIKESFAFPFMASSSVGKYWKTLSEAQKRLFLETYTEWTIATYAGRFNDYTGEKFEIVSVSEPVQGTITVLSKLIEPNKENVDFYYRLRKFGGMWCIADIQLSGVSQLALTRAQFVSVIKDKGFDALISMLREKIRSFSREVKQ